MNYYKPSHIHLIETRGNPGNITINGEINQFVHLKLPASKDVYHPAKPKCNYGSYHIYWSSHIKAVNCPKCLGK